MEDKKVSRNLNNLAIAALISEAEYDIFSVEPILKVPFDQKKSFYLAEVIKDCNLKAFIDFDLRKGQFTIHSHSVLKRLRQQWYKDNTKIFSMKLDPDLITLQSIVMCINLFGSRKLESISIPTNIEKEHIKAISYCIEQHLNVPVIPSPNQIKITNVPRFIVAAIAEIPAIHSAELINFLTEKEKKRIMEGASL